MKVPRWLKIIVLVYALVGILFYSFQRRVLFQPVVVAQDSVYQFEQSYEEVWIPVDETARTNMIHFTVPDSLRKGVVLYFHGNRGNVRRYRRFVNRFLSNGYGVWMPDYPGFGKSTGVLSEAAMYDQALQVYKRARQFYKPNEIIIYGKSMGTGVAAQLASVRDCKRLILETPYNSMRSLVGIYLWMYPLKSILKYQFPTDEYIAKITAPISIFHGTDDGVIPYSNASKLKKYLKSTDEFITIESGSHRDLNSFSLMQQKLDSLLKD